MLGALIGLLLTLVVCGVLWWAAKRLLALVPLEEPFRTLVDILLVVIVVLIIVWVFVQILAIAGIHVPFLH